ncbi:MAG: molybdopterin-dependent oxidoreductase, partial [Acidobacteria bacterium]|nr:molybdopterin-dependent oxidoreductase [Acidobacteriota bacterium]
MKHQIHTFCRVCEPACGLVAEVEDGRLVRLEPDREHPVTEGYACHKGLAGLDIHHDPDRVNHPLEKADGRFRRVSWDDAVGGIARRLRTILDESGPDAISAYVGNPSGFNVLARPAIQNFLGQLGVSRTFGSGTQDCANKFVGSEAVFGSSTVHPIPDFEHTDYLLILGENPAVSHMSFLGIADPMAVLRGVRRRGATIRFIDPRRIESAVASVGDVVQIRPDTDVYLLAAMLCEIDRTVGFDDQEVAAHGSNVEGLREFVRRFPPERVSSITGIDAAEIATLARDFATAPSASIHMSTGLNMGRQGTLAYWLVHALSFVTGNLDRRGGNILSEGFYFNAKAGRSRIEDGYHDTAWGTLRKGALPGNLIAEEILDSQRPIRALFVTAGNPVLSIAGEEKIRRAFESLDLLVTVDIYRNATGEMADYVLPATDMFEREDLNLNGLGLQHRPWVQWTPRVVEARAERREEWWIFSRLCQEMGLSSALDADPSEVRTGLWGKLDHMLRTRGHSLEELEASRHGIRFADHAPGSFFERHIQTEDRRMDCCPPAFADALDRAEKLFRELEETPLGLSLITRRDKYMHNSWYSNVESLEPPYHDRTFLYMHPSDAGERGLSEGEMALLRNENGEIEVEVRFDSALLAGVVAVPHGWGNK